MKNSTERYKAPQAEVIEIETQSVLCASGGSGGGGGTSRGAGTTSMGMSQIELP